MTNEEIQNRLIQQNTDSQHRTAELIADLQKKQAAEAAKLEALKPLVLPLMCSLAKQGLSVTAFTQHMNVNNDLVVSVSATSKEGSKFKFVEFAGYTKEGRGKNQKRLEAKAKKIEDAIFKDVGIKVGVNSFSLEIGREFGGTYSFKTGASTPKEPSPKNVLISFYL